MIARVIRCVNQNLSNAKDTHPRGCRLDVRGAQLPSEQITCQPRTRFPGQDLLTPRLSSGVPRAGFAIQARERAEASFSHDTFGCAPLGCHGTYLSGG